MAEQEIRTPKTESFGVFYPSGILMVGLMKTQFGMEQEVINAIESYLRGWRKDLREIERQADQIRHPRTSRDALGRGAGQGFTEAPEDTTLFCNPVHATLLGDFNLCTIFQTTSYGHGNLFSTFDYVMEFQVILGEVPCPRFDIGLNYLTQSLPTDNSVEALQGFYADFLRPLKAKAGNGQETSLLGHVKEMPLLTMAMLQMEGDIKAASPGGIVLPLLYTVDSILKTVCETAGFPDPAHPPIKGLLMRCGGWSDYCLLLRSSDLGLATRCIDILATMSLDVILNRWRELERRVRDNDSQMFTQYHNELTQQGEALAGRIDRLAKAFQVSTGSDDIQARTPLFTTTCTTPGLLWPCAQIAANSLANATTAQTETPTCDYDDLKIDGQIGGQVSILCKTAAFRQAMKICQEWTGRKLDGVVLGKQGLRLPLSHVARQPNLGDDHIDLKSFFAHYYRLHQLLAANEGPTVPVGASKGMSCAPIRNMSAQLVTRFDMPPVKQPYSGASGMGESITSGFQRMILAGEGNSHTIMEELLAKLKTAGVCKHIREALRQVVLVWLREMFSGSEVHHMIELADPFITWLNAVYASLDRPDGTIYDKERTIRFFTQPLWDAVFQRARTGFRMSEHSDYTLEYKGGMYKLNTGVDGIFKAVLSLVGQPSAVSGVTLVGHEDTPTIRCIKVPGANKDNCPSEYICAVYEHDFVHMVHALKISSTLHEMFSVVVICREFLQALSDSGGEIVVEALHAIQRDSETGLFNDRLGELLVDHLVNWLVFYDARDLASRSALMQFGLSPEPRVHDDDLSRSVLIEHMGRAFSLDVMLRVAKEQPTLDIAETTLKRWYECWWEKCDRWAFRTDSAEDTDRIKEAVLGAVTSWFEDSEFIQGLESIILAVRRFFDVDSHETEGESVPLRRQFLNTLRTTCEKVDFCQQTGGPDQLRADEPVHFVYFDPKHTIQPTLRVKRLESLVSYLALIRRFYFIIFDRLGNGPLVTDSGEQLYIRRSSDNGTPVIDEEELANSHCLLDPLLGTVFTVGKSASLDYASLRIAFMNSIWHVAEVAKLSNLAALGYAQQRFEENGEPDAFVLLPPHPIVIP